MKSENIDKRLLIIIPAICAFFLALIPTLKYQWPLGWDIFYHIHMAKLYSSQGIVFVDSIVNVPFGNNINYPPLFHLLIAFMGLSGIDYFQIARFMQPFLAGLIVLSISWAAWKFYDPLIGFFTGVLLLSSSLVSRIFISIPENMALILFPLSLYFYYLALKRKEYKNAIIGGLILGVIALIHQAATLCLLIIITTSTMVLIATHLFNQRSKSSIKYCWKVYVANYGILLIFGLLIAAIWWIPAILNTLKPAATGGAVMTSLIKSVPMSIIRYPPTFGSLLLIFSVLGVVLTIKRRKIEDLFILSWLFSMLLLSKSYFFGINVISYRVLIYALLPMSILAACGLKYITCTIYSDLKSKKGKSSSSPKTNKKYALILVSLLVGVILTFSIYQGIATVSSPKIADFGAVTSFGTISISPPTESQVDLAQWFNQNNRNNGTSTFSNYYAAMFNLAYTNQPITNLNQNYLNGTANKTEIEKNGVEYIVYDKRLAFSASNKTLFISESANSFYFYNKNLINISNIQIPYLTKSYENKEFVVYQVL